VVSVNFVEELLTASGLTVGSRAVVDWEVIERSLGGLVLPDDYKSVVEIFPHGTFKEFVSVIRPGIEGGDDDDYLGYYAHALEDMRGWREDGHGEFPYPIWPEPGGVLPWASTPDGFGLFWSTEGDDPARWPVVWADPQFSQWHRVPQTMAEFLVGLLRDPPPEIARFATFDLAAARPFRAYPPDSQVPAGGEPIPAPIPIPARARDPENEFDALIAAIGEEAGGSAGRDWAPLERAFGSPLPADYKAFCDELGPGLFCDILIFGVDTPGGLALSDLLRAQRAHLAAHPYGKVVGLLHPDPGGLIPWGATKDGWYFAWQPRDTDPQLWGVTAVGPGFRRVDLMELSFSSFLLQYAGVRDNASLFLFNRVKWTGDVIFERA
jgi:hypothetical protein